MSLSGKPSLPTLYSNVVSISALPLSLPSALPLFFFTTLSPSAGYKTHDAFTIYFSHHGVTPRKEALFSVLAIAVPRAEAGHTGVQQTFTENANMVAAYLGWGAVQVVLRTGAHALIWSSEWSLMALAHFLLFQRRILGSLREVKKFCQAGGFQSCLPMHSAILLCWPARWASTCFAKGLVPHFSPRTPYSYFTVKLCSGHFICGGSEMSHKFLGSCSFLAIGVDLIP